MSLFNQYPHIAEYRLAVWPSPVIVSGTIAGSPARGDRSIFVTIDISNPHFGAIQPGYTLEVHANSGTSRDWVRVRIRSYITETFNVIVAENAIAWANGQEFRIYKEIQPWSIKPRITVSDDQPTFLKDYDITYTNQNQLGRPVINMGPHRAGPVASNIYYTAAGSFDEQDQSIESYSWIFEGGTPSTSSLQAPGYVNYPSAGSRITTLTCVNSNGVSQSAYRFVNIGQEITEWGIESIDGDVGGGYTLKGWSRTNLDGILRAGALVVVYGEERFGGVRYAATETPYCTEIIFNGYISQRTVKWNARFSRWDFEAVSLSIYADKLDVYDTSLQFRENSNRWQWWKYYRLTADKAIIHHLRWHTNILDIADFVPTGDTRFVKNIDIGRGGPFTAIRQFLNSSLPGFITCNIQGKIFVARDPNIQETVERLDETWFTLGPDEYREEPYVVDADPYETSHMGAGGFAFSGATGTSTAYLSAAPMEAADDYGKPNDVQGLILSPGTGQDELNNICGHLYARANNEFADTNWPLVGNFRPFVDLVPRRKVLVNTPTDPLAWTNKVFYVNRITHKPDPNAAMMLTDLNLAAETIGLPGVSQEVPVPETIDPPPPPPPPPPIIPPAINSDAKILWLVHQNNSAVPAVAVIYEILDDLYNPVWKSLIPPAEMYADSFSQAHYFPAEDTLMIIGHATSTPIMPGWPGSESHALFRVTGATTNNPVWSIVGWAFSGMHMQGFDENGYGARVVPNNGHSHGDGVLMHMALGSNLGNDFTSIIAHPIDDIPWCENQYGCGGEAYIRGGASTKWPPYYRSGDRLVTFDVGEISGEGPFEWADIAGFDDYDYFSTYVYGDSAIKERLYFLRRHRTLNTLSIMHFDLGPGTLGGTITPVFDLAIDDTSIGGIPFFTNTQDFSRYCNVVPPCSFPTPMYYCINGVWSKAYGTVPAGFGHYLKRAGSNEIMFVLTDVVANGNEPARFTTDVTDLQNNPWVGFVGNMWTDTSSPKIITSGPLTIQDSFLSF